jgi:hypothetical protein
MAVLALVPVVIRPIISQVKAKAIWLLPRFLLLLEGALLLREGMDTRVILVEGFILGL